MSSPTSLKASAVSTFLSKGQRPAQEDFALVDRQKGIFIVADGFGGPIPGALAAKTACEAVRSFLFKEAGDLEATLPFVLRNYFSLAGNVLFNSLIHANRKVMSLNRGKNVHERGGASIVAGFIDGDLLAIANVGICSAWLIRDGKSVELVIPRSYGRLCDPFQTERNEELRAPLISIGTSEDLEPEIFEYKVRPGDWILFCTDGFQKDVIPHLFQIQQKKIHPDLAIQESLKLFNLYQYTDNSSLSLVII
jgi:serine/threonine protein phosphatase PrpC